MVIKTVEGQTTMTVAAIRELQVYICQHIASFTSVQFRHGLQTLDLCNFELCKPIAWALVELLENASSLHTLKMKCPPRSSVAMNSVGHSLSVLGGFVCHLTMPAEMRVVNVALATICST